MENKKLIEAALAIKKFCDTESIDDDGFCVDSKGNKCPLQNECGKCLVRSGEPCTWKVKKPRRFTDAEIQLAKVLKTFGYVEISRIAGQSSCHAYTEVPGEWLPTPSTAFKSIDYGETISLDNIIEDGED